MSRTPSDRSPPRHFPTTRWSRVIAAGDPNAPRARESLAVLCNAYWYPLYAYIRRQGQPPEAAADLTQDYFARLLERSVLAAADQSRGRFRAFLRTDCGFFLTHHRDHDRARKRGGGIARCRSTRASPRVGTSASRPTR